MLSFPHVWSVMNLLCNLCLTTLARPVQEQSLIGNDSLGSKGKQEGMEDRILAEGYEKEMG